MMSIPDPRQPLQPEFGNVRQREIYEQADVEDERLLREAEEAEEDFEEAREDAERYREPPARDE
jgi:hypothetical protein